MTALSSYSTGTVAVATDGITVTGTSTLWLTAGNAKPGDFFQVGRFGVFVVDVPDDGQLTIPPWGGATVSGAAYNIWRLPRSTTEVLADVDKIVGALNSIEYMVFVPSTLTAPDPSLGEEDQYAFQPATGAYWLMTGGVWVPSAGPVKGYGGTSTTSLAIGTGAKLFTTQSGLAYNGARVRAASTADRAKWMEGVATYAGTQLSIAVDRINSSGTFASWVFSIAGEPGVGDLQSANNLSDVANAATAAANLGVVRYAAAQSLTAPQKAQVQANMGVREVLTANRSYYVRTDGSDSNNGLANTSGGAFLTIQKAIDTAVMLDLSIYNVTINVADGTYTGGMALKSYLGVGPISIVGNTTTPANVLISVTSNFAVYASGVRGAYTINGMKLTTLTAGYDAVLATNFSFINLSNVHFGACGQAAIHTSYGAQVVVNTSYTIAGNAGIHWYAGAQSSITAAGLTITLSGTPAFSLAFAFCNQGGLLICNGNTFSGSATGSRYSASSGATIDTNGGGASYLPGNSAGSGTNYGASPYGLYT